MAICEACNREMLTADGCGMSHVTINGKLYERIKGGSWYGRCHDCGAKRNQYHHSGCDAEICPACGGQLISCDCDVGDFSE